MSAFWSRALAILALAAAVALAPEPAAFARASRRSRMPGEPGLVDADLVPEASLR